MMSGNGTIVTPWDLVTALASPQIEASTAIARTLYLLDVNPHNGDFVQNLDGASDRLITVRPLTSAKIDGSIVLQGSHTILRDLEIFWSGWSGRQSEQAGAEPTDLTLKNIGGNGTNLKLINCVIHDLSSPYFSKEMEGFEVYGCVIYHVGWLGSDRGHGHGLYVKNTVPTMTIKDNIILDNFGWGIHAYSDIGSELANFVIEGNTSIRAGSLSGTARPNFLLGAESGAADVASIVYNMSYGGSVGLQFYGAGATGVNLTDNYMPDGKTGTYNAVSESGNYWGAAIGNQVFVRPNEYKNTRANVTIYNEAEANSVSVDLSAVGGLSVGNIVSVRNVQDYFMDVQNLTLDIGKKITVSMINRTVATPIQWTGPATTFPKFGCFVVEKA